jgi:uncharacterized protein DUF3810
VISARPAIGTAVVAIAIAAAYAPIAPETVEDWFSTSTYPAIQRTITPVSNILPVALLDALSLLVLIVVVTIAIRSIQAARHAHNVRPVVSALGRLCVAAAAVYLAFLGLWGLNYRRMPMEQRLSVAPESPTRDAVLKLGMTAAARLNALYDEAHRQGWQEQPIADASLQRAFGEIQHALSDAPPAEPGRLKRSMFGLYFRWTSVDGMINPFGLEVLVNPDLLPFERPFVAAHEWAHLAGYADESEASFVGWLTCLRANAAAQYSGWVALYWQVSSEVDESDRTAIAKTLGDGPRRDLNAIVDRIRRSEQPWLRDAGWRVYDQYLKANRVEEGIRSYGAVLTLILRARLDDGSMPVRRDVQTGDRRPGS